MFPLVKARLKPQTFVIYAKYNAITHKINTVCLHDEVEYFWFVVFPDFHAVFHRHNDVVSSVVHALLRTLLGRTYAT